MTRAGSHMESFLRVCVRVDLEDKSSPCMWGGGSSCMCASSLMQKICGRQPSDLDLAGSERLKKVWNSAFSIALEISQASQTYIVYSCLFPFVRLKFAVDGFCISYLWVFDVLNLNSNYVHASLIIFTYTILHITYFMCINK